MSFQTSSTTKPSPYCSNRTEGWSRPGLPRRSRNFGLSIKMSPSFATTLMISSTRPSAETGRSKPMSDRATTRPGILMLKPNGRLIVAGYSARTTGRFAQERLLMVRYGPGGRVDQGFGHGAQFCGRNGDDDKCQYSSRWRVTESIDPSAHPRACAGSTSVISPRWSRSVVPGRAARRLPGTIHTTPTLPPHSRSGVRATTPGGNSAK